MDSIPQLLDLMSKDKEWGRNGCEIEDERKLELRLAPPGEENWSMVKPMQEHVSALSLGLFPNKTTNPSSGAKRGFTHTLENASKGIACSKTQSPANSQTKTSQPPAVGWPPVGSFRKNHCSSSSKPTSASQNFDSRKSKKVEIGSNTMFVKINMDGIPIGRKVDLKSNDSFEKLCYAANELFRGFLAAQRGTSASRIHDSKEENLAITGLLDGNGEYTLVYEDNEGYKILVGDVPWNMFISTVKRLRVMKSSDLSSALSHGAANKKRTVNFQPQNP